MKFLGYAREIGHFNISKNAITLSWTFLITTVFPMHVILLLQIMTYKLEEPFMLCVYVILKIFIYHATDTFQY